MKLRGEVVSGAGMSAQAMLDGELARYWPTYFGHLEPGTLNVRLDQPHAIVANLPLPRAANGTEVIAQRCTVRNLQAFIIKSLFDGEQPDETVLHIVSPFPLRRHLLLADGSEVIITVADVAEPSNEVKGRQ